MKRIIISVFVGLFVLSVGYAAIKTEAATSGVKAYIGTVVDNQCASGHPKDIGTFVKTHTKDCALMPGCIASGYSLYVDKKLLKFDAPSNKKIEKFLKMKKSTLDVIVQARDDKGLLDLVSIKNQKK